METLSKEPIQRAKHEESESLTRTNGLISFIEDVPSYLNDAMSAFIEEHPNWDQYRLIEAAVSGYLLQKGIESREINRIYFKSMFCKKAFGTSH